MKASSAPGFRRRFPSRLRHTASHMTALALLAALPGAAQAQTAGLAGMSTPGSSDLREVVQRAVSTNPEVQAAFNGFRASTNEVDVARGGYLPSIDVSAGVGIEDREGDGRGSFDTDFAELSLTQMIYDGFATRSEVERLDRAKLVRYYELLGASEEVALEAARAYQDVRRYRELVALARDNYREHMRVFNQIEERVASGAGRRVDLEQISGRLALAESNLMTEASNLHDVSSRFQRLVGTLPSETLAPAPSLDAELPPSVNDAVRMAYEGNPNFHAAIENIESARAEQAGTRSAFQPRLEFRARTGTNNQSDFTGRRDQHVAELVATMNLYRGGSDRASFRRASDLVEQSIDLRDVECVNLRQTTQIAYNDTQRLREQMQYLNEHRQSIDRVRGAYQQQFDIGQRTLLDVLDSENEYFEASRAYINAEYDVALADARTLAAMGQLMPTLGVMRDDTPSLAELSSDGVTFDPNDICPVQGPGGFTLQDLTGDIDVPAPTRAPDVTISADALFAVNSAELSPAAQNELNDLAAQIRQRNDLARVFIAGHADSTGTDAVNDPLSEARARSVADYLASQGVSPGLLESRGYGSNNPVASNDTADGRRQNRRVEVTLETNGENLDMTGTPLRSRDLSARWSLDAPAAERAAPASNASASQPAATRWDQEVASVVASESHGETLAAAAPASPESTPAAPADSLVQVVAVSSAERAAELEAQLSAELGGPVRVSNGGRLYSVQLGPVAQSEAEALRGRVAGLGFAEAYLISADNPS
ncbi:outer membrane protein, adhesin transport system [Franzmannia pantelleriensis]|uniref:Outer membrane protein, adhesin transport system n=1 Tax=Franzmannia pantelleriensis TaxID=48727 RepID=A0A1G9X932_9GAMM|nr:TolC family outer membrane protein [Halomonas pantelleriensis]SDM93254.1 outer membrane protein, adhesin transport system [Halomonas pantelleriensis]